MRDTFYILFLVFQLTICNGQNQEKLTEFCVINLLGAELYENPSFESRILYKLKIGDKLTSKTIISTKDTKMVGPNFNLGGDWIKTSVSGFNGFVFSSDLTKKNPVINTIAFGQKTIDLLGKKLNDKIVERIITIEKHEYQVQDKITEYENGTYTYKAFDSCFDHLTEYRNLELNEVYHQMVSKYCIYSSKGEYLIPVFQVRIGKTIKFESQGATQDLQIELKEDGIIKVSSYDCT